MEIPMEFLMVSPPVFDRFCLFLTEGPLIHCLYVQRNVRDIAHFLHAVPQESGWRLSQKSSNFAELTSIKTSPVAETGPGLAATIASAPWSNAPQPQPLSPHDARSQSPHPIKTSNFPPYEEMDIVTTVTNACHVSNQRLLFYRREMFHETFTSTKPNVKGSANLESWEKDKWFCSIQL